MALTKLGTANTNTLTPQIGDSITGNEYGVLTGKIKYIFGSASQAYNQRPVRGSPYPGPLPGFAGMFADASSAVRIAGDQAEIDVDYLGIDRTFVVVPTKRNDLEIKNIGPQSSNEGVGQLWDTFNAVNVPVFHPTLEFKFASLTPTNALGTYSRSLQNAPPLLPYVFRINTLDLSHPDLDLRVKTVQGTGELLTLDNSTNPPTCERTTAPWTATYTGMFATNGIATINFMDLSFTPDPNGWLCIKDDNETLAGGKVFQITQVWRSQYIFNGTIAGDWWDDARGITCT